MTIALAHDHVGICVTPDDLDATLDWYSSKLDFAVDRRFVVDGTTFAFIVSGGVKIELVAGASHRHEAPTDDLLASLDPERLHHFCIAVDDLEATVSQLRDRGVEPIAGPMDVPAIGQRIAFITDNTGNIIELAAPGTWPPDRHS
jgi:catechol 2,3-dioxygenase-like lactoylglutathione lyase family enzyme